MNKHVWMNCEYHNSLGGLSFMFISFGTMRFQFWLCNIYISCCYINRNRFVGITVFVVIIVLSCYYIWLYAKMRTA